MPDWATARGADICCCPGRAMWVWCCHVLDGGVVVVSVMWLWVMLVVLGTIVLPRIGL